MYRPSFEPDTCRVSSEMLPLLPAFSLHDYVIWQILPHFILCIPFVTLISVRPDISLCRASLLCLVQEQQFCAYSLRGITYEKSLRNELRHGKQVYRSLVLGASDPNGIIKRSAVGICRLEYAYVETALEIESHTPDENKTRKMVLVR